MSEFEQDPSANTGRFRAFVQQADDAPTRKGPSRGLLIGGAVVVLVIIVLLAALL